MDNQKNIGLQSLFDEFRQLPYPQKLGLFHSSFGIVPFPFPKIDMDISWFYNKSILAALTDNLSGEIKSRNLYEKSMIESGTTLVFDVKPKTFSQRIAYNRFLLSLFSSEQYTTQLVVPLTHPDAAGESLSFLIEKRWRIRSALTDTKQYLQNEGGFKTDIKYQFVKVFYSGFTGFHSQRSISLRVRHKFVEMYLYSQGQAVAGYIGQLQSLIEDVNVVLKTARKPSCG